MAGVSQLHDGFALYLLEEGLTMFQVSRKIMLVVICCIVAILALVFMLLFKSTSPKWSDVSESEQYQNFFHDKIKEISLQKSFNTKVVFSDEDLITKWEKFFNTLKISKERKKTSSDKNMNGGGLYVEVVTETANYIFSFIIPFNENEMKIDMGDYYYKFKSNEENPFNETYSIAKERYGEINLWE